MVRSGHIESTVYRGSVIILKILKYFRNTSLGKDSCSSTQNWNYFEDFWSCAGGLSAMNAIDRYTQLRDQINSRLTRWRIIVVYINKMDAAVEIGRSPP